MKKISIILMAVAFAATGISAKAKKNAAQIECESKAKDALKGAATSKTAALKECKAKKGQEKKDCVKGANDGYKEAAKGKKAADAECAKLAAIPEIPAIPGAPSIPGMGGK